VTINYYTPAAAKASVRIDNVMGQTLMTRDLGTTQAGSEAITISNLPAGVYMVTLTSGNDKMVKRLVKE
jgi:hypothetical protein